MSNAFTPIPDPDDSIEIGDGVESVVPVEDQFEDDDLEPAKMSD